MAMPSVKPDMSGAQKEIVGKDVQPNQKKDTAKSGAAQMAALRRSSGGTGAGAHSRTLRSYEGWMTRRYCVCG